MLSGFGIPEDFFDLVVDVVVAGEDEEEVDQAIEVFQHAPEPEYARKYQRFYSSDAHQLGDISECIHSIDMENRSRQAFFQLMSW